MKASTKELTIGALGFVALVAAIPYLIHLGDFLLGWTLNRY